MHMSFMVRKYNGFHEYESKNRRNPEKNKLRNRNQILPQTVNKNI